MDVSCTCRMASMPELHGMSICADCKIHNMVQSHDSIRGSKEMVSASSSQNTVCPYRILQLCDSKFNERGEEETMFCNSFYHLGQQDQTISPMGPGINKHCAGEDQQQLEGQSVSQPVSHESLGSWNKMNE
jgi:hypothetical protein